MRRHRTEEYAHLMNSRAWRRLRMSYRLPHPLCEDCLLKDCTTPAKEVHHIYPIERAAGRPNDMKRLCLDPANLRALCHACHVKAHQRLASSSKQEAKARAREALDAFTERYLAVPDDVKA